MKFRHKMFIPAYAILMFVSASSALAQPPAGAGRRGMGPPESFEEVEQRIRMVRSLEMVQALNLDEKQALEIVPKFNDIAERQRKLHWENAQQFRALRSLLDQEKPDEKKLAEVMNEIRDNRQEMQKLKAEEDKLVTESFDTETQARYYLFERKFGHKMMRHIEKARRGGGPGDGTCGEPGRGPRQRGTGFRPQK